MEKKTTGTAITKNFAKRWKRSALSNLKQAHRNG